MKRSLNLILVLCMLFILTACGSSFDFGPDTSKLWGDMPPKSSPSPLQTEIPAASAPANEYVSGLPLTLVFGFGERTGTYSGEMANGLPNGYGIFSADIEGGDVTWTYEGEWANGHENGLGTVTYSDGYVVTGTFTDDWLNGEGSVSYNGGLRYAGSFIDGSYHGQGTLYNYHDFIMFSGSFDHGLIQESAADREIRIGAFKMNCHATTFEEIYNDAQNGLADFFTFSGTVLQIFSGDSSSSTSCNFLMNFEGAEENGQIVSVCYPLSTGETMTLTEGQSVSVWGTPAFLFDYSTADEEILTVPQIEAWSIE